MSFTKRPATAIPYVEVLVLVALAVSAGTIRMK
jgi:hypothetical protein